jgi:hypothetical protein
MSRHTRSAHAPENCRRSPANEPQSGTNSQRVRSDHAFIRELASRSGVTFDVVKDLYDREVAALETRATVKTFIDVVARARIQRHLAALRRKTPRQT